MKALACVQREILRRLAFVHVWTANLPIQSLITALANLAYIYQVRPQVLGVDVRCLFWLTEELFHFHHIPRVAAHTLLNPVVFHHFNLGIMAIPE
jgi:hypothetical protein